MAISAVVAVSAAASYENNRKAQSAQKRAVREQKKVANAELKRQQELKAKQEAADSKKQKLEALKAGSGGTQAQQRIAAERSYLRRGRRGRMGTIKGAGL